MHIILEMVLQFSDWDLNLEAVVRGLYYLILKKCEQYLISNLL
jgi:hypothetical protein